MTPNILLRFHKWIMDTAFIAVKENSWFAAHIAVMCQRQMVLCASSLRSKKATERVEFWRLVWQLAGVQSAAVGGGWAVGW